MSELGIPYAYGDFDPDGALVRICPICDARIRETADADGEQTSDNYGQHYESQHRTRTRTEAITHADGSVTIQSADPNHDA